MGAAVHAAADAGGRGLVLAVVGDLAAHQQVALAVPLGPTFDTTYITANIQDRLRDMYRCSPSRQFLVGMGVVGGAGVAFLSFY